MMADTTWKKNTKKKTFLILTGVFCTVGGTLVKIVIKDGPYRG
jgi:hypothetical protein